MRLWMMNRICVIWEIFMFILSMRFYGEYQCVKKHFPEKFIQVELVPEDESDIHKNVLDKGKAIYDRTYIVGNIRYRTEITSKEFDDNFYICEDNPREVYSEYDIFSYFKIEIHYISDENGY